MPFTLPAYQVTIYSFVSEAMHYVNNDADATKRTYKALPPIMSKQNEVIKGREVDSLVSQVVDGAGKLITGLTPTIWPGWFTGEHKRRSNGKKINTFLLIHFTTDKSIINVFSFPNVNIENNQSFASLDIPAIIKEQFL